MNTVFLITNNYKPYSGGVVSSLEVLQSALRDGGYAVYIITLDFTGEIEKDPHVFRLYCPIRFMYKNNHMAFPWRAQKQLEYLTRTHNPSILHIHHPFLLGRAALNVGLKYKIPTVFTYHTRYEYYTHYIPYVSNLIKPFIKSLVNNFCKKITAIVAPSFLLSQEIGEKNNLQGKIFVIPSAVKKYFFLEKLPKKVLSKKINLLIVSRFTPEKNIPFLLRVYTFLKSSEYNFTLVGYGYAYKSLQEYAYKTLKLSPEVLSFVIKPSQEELIHQYRNADIFLFASTTETQGLVLAEAMASGLPVIALNAPSSSEIVKHGCNGYLVENEREMAFYIQHLKNNPAVYNQIRSNAFNTANRYTQEEMGIKMNDLYTNLIVRKDI